MRKVGVIYTETPQNSGAARGAPEAGAGTGMETGTRIYFDHAATTPLDREVFEKMRPYFTDVFGNADSLHSFGREGMRAVDESRDLIASLIGARPEEVYFTSGGTESDNWAILGAARAQRKKGKPKVLISAVEHHAAISAGERLEKEGIPVGRIPVNKEGRAEPETVRAMLTPEVGLVAVMAANNETGAVQPFRECARLAHENGSLFFTDAVQAAPYLRIDVEDWGADLLSFSAHKFYGPKGIGALYIRRGTGMERLISGGEQERGLRGGTVNVPSVVGLAAAYEKTLRDLDKNNAKIRALKTLFLKEFFAEIPEARINGGGESLPGILNLRLPGVDNAAFLFNMDLHGVALSAGSACAASSLKPSHVLTAMGLSEKEAGSSVRLSFGRDNTEEEIVRGAALAAEICKKIRG